MSAENKDLKVQIEETMGFLSITGFNDLDPSLVNLNPEGFLEFVQQRTSSLSGDQRTRAISFLASRKSYLDMLRETNS